MNIEVRDLSKTYPNGTRALGGVSLDIPMGMFGLLGPNGAGKSSPMRTIATLQEADSGSIRMGELDVLRDKDAMRARLGYLPQAFGVYPGLSAVSLLNHIAILLPRYEERYRVISTRFVAGQILLNAFGVDQPGAEFSPATPDLKDVYFCALKGWFQAPAAAAAA